MDESISKGLKNTPEMVIKKFFSDYFNGGGFLQGIDVKLYIGNWGLRRLFVCLIGISSEGVNLFS